MNNRCLPRILPAVLIILLLTGPVFAPVMAQTTAPTYVIATHYPDFGGTDPAPRDAVQVAYTVYNNRENDYAAVDAATADTIQQRISTLTGKTVLLLNDWAEVTEDTDALQIVNNVPLEGALYTIVLPSGWNRSKKLPVALSGNGASISNNRRLYASGEVDLPVLVGFSTLAGGSGFIGAMSNCGGTESQGVDEVTYRSVGAFFDFIDQNGGDKHNALTAGWSRGGGSALMWAINPLKLDYTVNIVFAGVPPTEYGTLSQVSVLTYPSMAGIGTLVGQDENAWNYRNDGLRPGMNPSPFIERLLGTGDPAAANALSPMGMADGLIGKQVLIEFGSHDPFFPLAPFLAFDRRLTELGVHHATVVTLNSGHEDGVFARQEVVNALTALVQGEPYTMPTGRYYYMDLNPLQDNEVPLAEAYATLTGEPNNATHLPLTVRLPYQAGTGNPADIEVCGTPGVNFRLQLLSSGDQPASVYDLEGTLDETECSTAQIIMDFPPGDYHWWLSFETALVGIFNTPGFYTEGDLRGCHIPATTTILAEQPHPDDTYPSIRSLGWGMLLIVPPDAPENATECKYG